MQSGKNIFAALSLQKSKVFQYQCRYIFYRVSRSTYQVEHEDEHELLDFRRLVSV